MVPARSGPGNLELPCYISWKWLYRAAERIRHERSAQREWLLPSHSCVTEDGKTQQMELRPLSQIKTNYRKNEMSPGVRDREGNNTVETWTKSQSGKSLDTPKPGSPSESPANTWENAVARASSWLFRIWISRDRNREYQSFTILRGIMMMNQVGDPLGLRAL